MLEFSYTAGVGGGDLHFLDKKGRIVYRDRNAKLRPQPHPYRAGIGCSGRIGRTVTVAACYLGHWHVPGLTAPLRIDAGQEWTLTLPYA